MPIHLNALIILLRCSNGWLAGWLVELREARNFCVVSVATIADAKSGHLVRVAGTAVVVVVFADAVPFFRFQRDTQ